MLLKGQRAPAPGQPAEGAPPAAAPPGQVDVFYCFPPFFDVPVGGSRGPCAALRTRACAPTNPAAATRSRSPGGGSVPRPLLRLCTRRGPAPRLRRAPPVRAQHGQLRLAVPARPPRPRRAPSQQAAGPALLGAGSAAGFCPPRGGPRTRTALFPPSAAGERDGRRRTGALPPRRVAFPPPRLSQAAAGASGLRATKGPRPQRPPACPPLPGRRHPPPLPWYSPAPPGPRCLGTAWPRPAADGRGVPSPVRRGGPAAWR